MDEGDSIANWPGVGWCSFCYEAHPTCIPAPPVLEEGNGRNT